MSSKNGGDTNECLVSKETNDPAVGRSNSESAISKPNPSPSIKSFQAENCVLAHEAYVNGNTEAMDCTDLGADGLSQIISVSPIVDIDSNNFLAGVAGPTENVDDEAQIDHKTTIDSIKSAEEIANKSSCSGGNLETQASENISTSLPSIQSHPTGNSKSAVEEGPKELNTNSKSIVDEEPMEQDSNSKNFVVKDRKALDSNNTSMVEEHPKELNSDSKSVVEKNLKELDCESSKAAAAKLSTLKDVNNSSLTEPPAIKNDRGDGGGPNHPAETGLFIRALLCAW